MRRESYPFVAAILAVLFLAGPSRGAGPSASVDATVSIAPSPDSDGDGLTDATEAWLGTAADRADTDGDSLTDGEELSVYRTDPIQLDSDGDGLPDGWEVRYRLSPLAAQGDDGASGDPDNDGSNNRSEYVGDTDPTNAVSRLHITALRLAPAGLEIEWSGGLLATQYLETCNTLGAGSEGWASVFTNLPPTLPSFGLTNTAGTNEMLLYRIRAER